MQKIANVSIINHRNIVLGKHDSVGFIDVESGQATFHYVIGKKVCDKEIWGISCVSGHENELIYAIGDISIPPRIILYGYPEVCIGQLQCE